MVDLSLDLASPKDQGSGLSLGVGEKKEKYWDTASKYAQGLEKATKKDEKVEEIARKSMA